MAVWSPVKMDTRREGCALEIRWNFLEVLLRIFLKVDSQLLQTGVIQKLLGSTKGRDQVKSNSLKTYHVQKTLRES